MKDGTEGTRTSETLRPSDARPLGEIRDEIAAIRADRDEALDALRARSGALPEPKSRAAEWTGVATVLIALAVTLAAIAMAQGRAASRPHALVSGPASTIPSAHARAEHHETPPPPQVAAPPPEASLVGDPPAAVPEADASVVRTRHAARRRRRRARRAHRGATKAPSVARDDGLGLRVHSGEGVLSDEFLHRAGTH